MLILAHSVIHWISLVNKIDGNMRGSHKSDSRMPPLCQSQVLLMGSLSNGFGHKNNSP